MTSDETLYGYLIVLGTNGKKVTRSSNIRETNKLKVVKRKEANGIKLKSVRQHGDASHNQAVQSRDHYTVSYKISERETVVKEYVSDSKTDMYQIGRSTDDQIDIVVNSFQQEPAKKNKGNDKNEAIGVTVSRYACRILINREAPHEAYIYAAGFDNHKNIFLGENAIKWKTSNSLVDGFTTNGVMIRYPDKQFNSNFNGDLLEEGTINQWKEVSVSGTLYTCVSRRGEPRSQYKERRSNLLIDGTLIDLCGITLIWRTDYTNILEPQQDVQSICNKLNETHIQCPVRYETIRISPEYSMRRNDKVETGSSRQTILGASGDSSAVQININDNDDDDCSGSSWKTPSKKTHFSQALQPWVYINCGHVVGKHNWKGKGDTNSMRTCPLCKMKGLFIKLCLGQEAGFYADWEIFTHCFNPCGHMASEATVKYWCQVEIPNSNDIEYSKRCPFCYQLIDPNPVRLFFQ